jgi:ABC-2 type transport system permease protein
MKKTMLVMLNEVGTSLRRAQFIIMAIGLPLLAGIAALIIILVNRDAPQTQAPPPVEQLEQTQSDGFVDPGNLIQALPEDLPPGLLVAYEDQASAQAALEAEEIGGYYLIPADYAVRGELTYVRVRYNPASDHLGTGALEGAMEWVLFSNLVGDAETAANIWHPFDLREVALKGTEPEAEDSWIVELFPTLMTLILYMVILMPASGLVNAITDEKKNRILEVLMSSLSPDQLLTGKILALGLLGLLQTALWVGVLWLVVRFGGQALNIPTGFEVPTSMVVWAFVYGFLGYAMYGAQLAGLGALVPDLKDARGASFLLLSPMIIVYVLMTVIFVSPNGAFALFMSFFPLTAPVGMIARMTATTVPVWQAVLAAVVQVLTAILIVRLVTRMFHAQNLLSGQPFSVQRYFRILLGRPA